MKTRIIQLSILLAFISFTISCKNQASKQEKAENKTELSSTKSVSTDEIIVEAACGECQFGLEGTSCDLAVRIDGKAYFVDGTNIDEHGDAHAEDGFCSTIRKASVTGHIENDRFIAESFVLLEQEDHHDHDNGNDHK